MATYYVKKIDGTIYYKSGSIPTASDSSVGDLQAVIELGSVTTGDTIFVCAGTFTGTEIDSTKVLIVDEEIIFSAAPGDKGRVILDFDGATGNGIWPVVHCATEGTAIIAGFKLQGISSAATNYSLYTSANKWHFDDIEISGGYRGLYCSSSSDVFNRIYIHDTVTEGAWVSAGATFNYGKISGGITGINILSGSPIFNNVDIVGTSSSAIYHSGSGTPEFRNSIITAAAYGNAAEYPINNDGAAMVITTPIITPNPASLTKLVTGSSVTLTDPIYKMPLYRSGRRPAIVIFGVDDSSNLAYFQTVAAKLEAKGWRGTFAVTDPASLSTANKTTIASLHTGGHDMACHGVTYSSLMTDTTGMRIQYVGAGSVATMTISGNVLTTACTGDAGSNLNLNLASASYDTLNEVCTYIDGLAGYTCTRLNADTSVLLASSYLADVAGQDIMTGTYDADLSATKVYDGEMAGCKTALESAIGTTISSWVCPGNASDATIQAALLARGFSASRGSGTTGQHTMTSMSVFNIQPLSLYSVFGNDANPQTTSGKVEQYTAGMLEYLKFIGGVYFFFAHSTSEFSSAAWDALLTEVAKGGVQVMTLAQAGAYIISNGTDSGDHMTYTRTFTDGSDYRLKAGSPAIGVGVDVGLTTDILGKPIRGLPDIGCHEFQPMSGNFAFTFGIGF